MADATVGRREDISGRPLDPNSLCGSWFHRLDDGALDHQGLIVAEVQPGAYLAEIFNWATGQAEYQTVFTMAEMVGKTEGIAWRFYDNADWMRRAYDMYVAQVEATA